MSELKSIIGMDDHDCREKSWDELLSIIRKLNDAGYAFYISACAHEFTIECKGNTYFIELAD